jgi:2'-5' RNA ligase
MKDQYSEPMFRLFVAISIPERIRREIFRVQQELEPLTPRGAVRWTRPDQIHLTLRFLGDVPAARLEALKESLGAVCRGVRPLRLRAEGIGFFPNDHSPRVIWVGVNEAEGLLVDLQRRIETAARSFTAESSPETFVGHATLGRCKSFRPSDLEKLLAQVRVSQGRAFGEWTAPAVEIIRSQLSPAGALYTVLAALPLTGGN